MASSSLKNTSSNRFDELYIYDTKSPDQVQAASTTRRQRAKAAKALAQSIQTKSLFNTSSSTTQAVVCGVQISLDRAVGEV